MTLENIFMPAVFYDGFFVLSFPLLPPISAI